MENVGVKAIASDMNLSSSLLYKWWQPSNEEDENGTTNPLDRVAKIFEATGDENLLAWVCQQADGFFSPNRKVGEDAAENLFANTHRLVTEFSDLLRDSFAELWQRWRYLQRGCMSHTSWMGRTQRRGRIFCQGVRERVFKIEEEKEPEIWRHS